MLTLHEAAAQGNIERLESLLDSKFNVDQPDDKGRTALSQAAMKGKIDAVKFLLRQGANINAKDDKDRTVLWYASESHFSVEPVQRFAVVDHLLREGANPNIAALDTSTPLTKFIEKREATAIKLLVDSGASTKHQVKKGSLVMSVEEFGRATKDQDVIQALKRTPEVAATKEEVVVEIVNYLLKSIGYMNTTLGGAIKKIFGISGDMEAPLTYAPLEKNLDYPDGSQTKDSRDDADSVKDVTTESAINEALRNRIHGESSNDDSLNPGGNAKVVDTFALGQDQPVKEDPPAVSHVPHVSDISERTTAEDFQKGMMKFISETGLDYFFPEGDDFLVTVASKAVELQNNKDNLLKTDDDIQGITKLALYQPVFYCDDSTSMKAGTRASDQVALVKRVARISTLLVPDGYGTGLQFINHDRSLRDDLVAKEVEKIMEDVKPRGNTKIGTNLELKILNPLIYDVVNGKGKIQRPILVSCITDGCASGESQTRFRDTIINCVNFLEDNGYPPTTVRFQISQIGNDRSAHSFLAQLREDPALQDVLFCTTQRLDEQYKQLNQNEEDLERWLLKTLLGPITSFKPE